MIYGDRHPEDAASHITVSDPVQHTEGMNKFKSYSVDVRGSIDPFTPDDVNNANANAVVNVNNNNVANNANNNNNIDEIEGYVNGLDEKMKIVFGQASVLVCKGKEIANGIFEFGLAFTLLGQSESGSVDVTNNNNNNNNNTQTVSLAEALARMGTAVLGCLIAIKLIVFFLK